MNSITYKNGNTMVKLLSDGTKYRYTPEDEIPDPEFPESIDLKITNYCEVGCPMCHEMSSRTGMHGYLMHPILKTLHRGMELAIGGGDPMSHPALEGFLQAMYMQGVVCNLTVHWSAFLTHRNALLQWTKKGLIHGLGVSVNEIVPCEIFSCFREFPDLVVHVVLGIAGEGVFRQLMDRDLNILMLGYKDYGRGKIGENIPAEMLENAKWVEDHIKEFPDHFKAVTFDNLSIEQLELKKKLTPEYFYLFYMGNDGEFSMYMDLVNKTYAVSSVSERHKIDKDSIEDLFKEVKKCRRTILDL